VSSDPRPELGTQPLSVAHRARLIKTLCARLVRFPRRDEVLTTLLRRWPSLFDGTRGAPGGGEPTSESPEDTGRSVPGDPAHRTLQQEIVQLREALESNRDIGAATGIVMSRFRLTRDQAFDALRMVSQRQHRKLREVADEVLITGTLDTAALQDRAATRRPRPPIQHGGPDGERDPDLSPTQDSAAGQVGG
jgi:ANTAR domain